jgi:DNA relaxase NicK
LYFSYTLDLFHKTLDFLKDVQIHKSTKAVYSSLQKVRFLKLAVQPAINGFQLIFLCRHYSGIEIAF